ncbi:MAG: PQQ-binding-like beta-propeller repeat protein [Gemmataceae bacterium]
MYRLPILALALVALSARADDWPQWLGTARDGVWRETGILTKFPKGGPKELWRVPVGGGYAGPAVADGLVYVTDRQLAAGQKDPANPFSRANSKGTERVLALDAKTGKEVWKHEYDSKYTMSYPAGPRATPVVQGGKLWTVGGMGDLLCLDAKKGTLLWSKSLIKDYDASVPVWGFAAHLLIDGDNVITLASRKAVAVALNKDTGKEAWRALEVDSAEIGYAPPVVYTFGGRRQLIIWHPEGVNGLDPATGKRLWSYPWNVQANLTVPTPRQVGERLFLTAFYNGSRLLDVTADGVKEVWRSKGRSEQDTQALHSIMPTPFVEGRVAYGVCSYGQLRAIDLEDGGSRLWEDLTATGTGGKKERWANAFLTPNGGRWFLFNEKGDLLIAKLTPKGYEEVDRAHLIAPTGQLGGGKMGGGRVVVWTHPAYANRAIYVRNDKEVAAFSLAAE